MADRSRGTIKSTRTSLRIIESLQELDGGRVTELADRLDLSPSTVHSHLNTLREAEYVTKEGDTYCLGLTFLNIGEYVRERKTAYVKAEEKVQQLAEETNGRAHFVVEEHGRGVYLHTQPGKYAVKAYSDEGKKFHLHVAAAGKSILASLPDERVEEIVDRWGLPRETPNTTTDADELFAELREIRDTGVAFNREEHLKGIKAVGAPVQGDDGTVIGAFSVSGPTHRMKNEWFEEELPDLVLGTANELEIGITYS